MSEKFCLACASVPEDVQFCKNSMPRHGFCKTCFTNYVQAQVMACRKDGLQFNAEKIKCMNPTCKVLYAKKFVVEAIEAVETLASSKPLNDFKGSQMNKSDLQNVKPQ